MKQFNKKLMHQLYGVEMNPNIRFNGETNNNIIIPRTPFELTNDEWVTINSMDLTSNDGNFGINIYLNLCAHLEVVIELVVVIELETKCFCSDFSFYKTKSCLHKFYYRFLRNFTKQILAIGRMRIPETRYDAKVKIEQRK